MLRETHQEATILEVMRGVKAVSPPERARPH